MKRQQIILASLGSLTVKYDELWEETLRLFCFSASTLSVRVYIKDITDIAHAMKEDLENV